MEVVVTIDEQTVLLNGFSTVSIAVPDLGVSEVLDISFDVLNAAFGQSNPESVDLLLIGCIVYVLDKAVPRRIADDYWTREFTVEFPVLHPETWNPQASALAKTLEFLTGDEWSISFGQRDADLFVPRRTRRMPSSVGTVEAVSLFSGGVDSFAGSLNWLMSTPSGKLALLGHYDATQPSADQQRLWKLLEDKGYEERVDLRRMRVRPLPAALARPGQSVQLLRASREPTLRSRSFLFLALGLYSACAVGARVPLLMPENGVIAINIPLTPSRAGTCSTRTTHPYFLDTLGVLLRSVGIQNPIVNPFEFLTKGEILKGCEDRDVLSRLAHESVSCSHPSRRGTWRRRQARNCGYCIPCLYRRAAFHQVEMDDGCEYGLDVCTGEVELSASIAADLCAVLDCLEQVKTRNEVEERVLMTGPLGLRLDTATDVVSRGLMELRSFFRDKGTEELRERTGIR